MGMLSNLGNSLKRRIGLGDGPSAEDLNWEAWNAKIKETERLQEEQDLRVKESELVGKVARSSQGSITLGDTARKQNIGAERRQLRATGRFAEDRLVL